MTKRQRMEGFWRSAYEPHFPKPTPDPNFDNWTNKENFIEALNVVENTKAIQRYYKGCSTCRICKCGNGSCEYEFKGWRWPEGFKHYILEHNIRPSSAFETFIIHQMGC